MNKNICFIWDTDALDTAELTASAEVTGWPVNNLKHLQPAKAYKCSEGTGVITIHCDRERMARAVAIVGHNLGVDSRVIVRGYDLNGDVINSEEFEVILPVYTAGELLPCISNAFGYPTAEDMAVLPRTTAIFFLKNPMCVAKYEVEINNGDKPFHIGRMIIGDYFSPKKNIGLNWSGAPVDETNSLKSLGGQTYPNQMSRRRYQFSFSIKYLTEAENFGPVWKMLSHCGTSRPFVVCMVPDDDFMRQYTTLYCSFQSNPKPICSRKGAYPYSLNVSVGEWL